jgi:hypothetical protein
VGAARTSPRGQNLVASKEKKATGGQGDATRPVALAKIFPFAVDPNHFISLAVSFSQRGAARDRHGRWERDAVDAIGASDESADADGEVVWS